MKLEVYSCWLLKKCLNWNVVADWCGRMAVGMTVNYSQLSCTHTDKVRINLLTIFANKISTSSIMWQLTINGLFPYWQLMKFELHAKSLGLWRINFPLKLSTAVFNIFTSSALLFRLFCLSRDVFFTFFFEVFAVENRISSSSVSVSSLFLLLLDLGRTELVTFRKYSILCHSWDGLIRLQDNYYRSTLHTCFMVMKSWPKVQYQVDYLAVMLCDTIRVSMSVAIVTIGKLTK